MIFSLGVADAQDTPPNITLYVDRDYLAIYISADEPTSLVGFSFGVATAQGTFESYGLIERFPILRLTSGLAEAGSCFVYALQGSDAILPSDCTSQPSRFFRQEIPRADVFWYDFTQNRARDIAILSDKQSVTICSSAVPSCPITYVSAGAALSTQPSTENATVDESTVVTTNASWTPIYRTFNDIEMALVPKGCFRMGSSDEQYEIALQLCEQAAGQATCAGINFQAETPQTDMCFDTQYWVGRYEVTNAQYGSYGTFSNADKPREEVSWNEAQTYCAGVGARLLTEAEWEYAARGPDGLIFPWGDEFIAKNVVYKLNAALQTANVTRNESGASWVGAQHMSGNVWEWTSTYYEDYPYSATDGRESMGRLLVIRGGSWGDGNSIIRPAYRGKAAPDYRDEYTGFRCGRDFEETDLLQ